MKKETSTWPVPSYRRGPALSFSVPPSCNGNEPVCIRDCWVRDVGHRNPTPSWDSWLFNPSLSQHPFNVNGSLNQASFSGSLLLNSFMHASESHWNILHSLGKKYI
jgi:hypothetical protein